MWSLVYPLGKIFDVSAPDLWKIWSGSCKDMHFFPEETTESWKKRVATEFQDPVRIWNKIFKDPDKFTIVFESRSSQEIDKSWKKRVATEFQDPDRIQNKIIKDPNKFTINFKLGISQEIDKSWNKRVATEWQDPVRILIIQIWKKKISDHIFQGMDGFPQISYEISWQDLRRIGLGLFQDVIIFLAGFSK